MVHVSGVTNTVLGTAPSKGISYWLHGARSDDKDLPHDETGMTGDIFII